MANDITEWFASIVGFLVGLGFSVLLVLGMRQNGGGRIPIIVLIGCPLVGMVLANVLAEKVSKLFRGSSGKKD